MKSKITKNNILQISLALIIIIGSVIVYLIADNIVETEHQRRQAELQLASKRAVHEFSESIGTFVGFMSGVKSYLKYVEKFPTEEQLFEFVQYQLQDLDYKDSLVISFLNPEHTFVYSFDRKNINPSNLVGVSITEFRNDLELARLEQLMQDEDFHLFAPLNLVEGWVGIPLDFNVVRDSLSIGYIAALINSKSLINSIFRNQEMSEIAFRFSVGGVEFDREQVYDDSKVYHDRSDQLYYRGYELDEDDYLNTKFQLYGQDFEIGVAFINLTSYEAKFQWILILWFLAIAVLGLYSIYINNQYRTAIIDLNESNLKISEQHVTLENQNRELNEANHAKDRIFSIIGHDLKSPLAGLVATIRMVNSKDIPIENTAHILSKLGPATESALELLESLLKWAMINTNEISTKLVDFTIQTVFEDVRLLLGGIADDKGITIVTRLDKDLIINTDFNMFSFIVRNLVGNAIKFSAKGSEITLSAFKKNNLTYIEVKDEGIGISQSDINKLLETDLDLTRRGTLGEEGSGLGLAVSKEFAKRLQCKIEIEGTKNVGSIFRLIIL